jgi:hypothetical protein
LLKKIDDGDTSVSGIISAALVLTFEFNYSSVIHDPYLG